MHIEALGVAEGSDCIKLKWARNVAPDHLHPFNDDEIHGGGKIGKCLIAVHDVTGRGKLLTAQVMMYEICFWRRCCWEVISLCTFADLFSEAATNIVCVQLLHILA